MYGDKVTVELGAGEPLEAPAPRPNAPATLFDRYLRSVSYASLLYAVATGAATGSSLQVVAALLLVNPVPALAGRESADRSASARVLRAGGTVAGSRSGRAISRPDVVTVDEPRPLCGGWELSRTLTLSDAYDEQEVLGLASAVSAAAGSPWV